MFLVVCQFFLLLAFEGSHALEHFIPVNQGAIELRTVDADELRLATNGQTAGTAHTRTIDHDGVQRHFAGDVMLLGGEVRELHHDRRTDGKNLVYVFLFDELLDTDSHHALLAIRAIVGHDDDLVRRLAYLIFQYNKILGTASHDAEHTVALGFQGLDDGQHGSYAQSATCTNHGSVVLDASRVTQRTNNISYKITLTECTKFL